MTISGQGARLVRIARGFASPESRPEYVSRLRHRLHDVAWSARVRADLHGRRCRVCRSPEVEARTISHFQDAHRTCTVLCCPGCGYIANPANANDYRRYTSVTQYPLARRVGLPERPGREYHMVEMGLAMLGRPGTDVLIYAPGRSVDFVHAARLPGVRRVAVGDVVNVYGGLDDPYDRDDTVDFVNVLGHTGRRFDLVIASEVVERFTRPHHDFRTLFRLVTAGGLVVCSTNIYDGGDLSRHNYLFVKGHASYYTPASITHLARAHGMYVDFRLPAAATTYVGPRKRYVLFTRSADRLMSVACYFGDHTYAPSET